MINAVSKVLENLPIGELGVQSSAQLSQGASQIDNVTIVFNDLIVSEFATQIETGGEGPKAQEPAQPGKILPDTGELPVASGKVLPTALSIQSTQKLEQSVDQPMPDHSPASNHTLPGSALALPPINLAPTALTPNAPASARLDNSNQTSTSANSLANPPAQSLIVTADADELPISATKGSAPPPSQLAEALQSQDQSAKVPTPEEKSKSNQLQPQRLAAPELTSANRTEVSPPLSQPSTPSALATHTGPAVAQNSIPGSSANFTENAPIQPGRLEQLVDALAEARQSNRSVRGDVLLRHAEFGAVALRMDQIEGDLTARLSSRDPGFAAAAQAALNERIAISAPPETNTAQQRGSDQSGQHAQSREAGLSGDSRGHNDRKDGPAHPQEDPHKRRTSQPSSADNSRETSPRQDHGRFA